MRPFDFIIVFFRSPTRWVSLTSSSSWRLALAINFAAGVGADVQNWADQNVLVLAMIPVILLALFVKVRWVQIVCPLAMVAAFLTFLAVYYPVLR